MPDNIFSLSREYYTLRTVRKWGQFALFIFVFGGKRAVLSCRAAMPLRLVDFPGKRAIMMSGIKKKMEI